MKTAAKNFAETTPLNPAHPTGPWPARPDDNPPRLKQWAGLILSLALAFGLVLAAPSAAAVVNIKESKCFS